MEIREIKTFLYVARLRNFSEAAKQLGYTQAAVTIQIKKLEQELNVHLFDRIGKQISLTQQGEVFYSHALKILNDISIAKESISDNLIISGSLSIGTIESICTSLLSPLFREYHRLYPQVNIKIIIDSPENLLHMMDKNSLDLVYFIDRPMHDKKWIKVLQKPEDIVFVCSPQHPLAGKKASLEEVIRYPFLFTEKDASYRSLLEQYLASTKKEIKPFLETGNTDFIIQQLYHNLGVSFLPRFTIQKDMEKGKLALINVENFQLQVWRQIIHHKDKWISRQMNAFLRLAVPS